MRALFQHALPFWVCGIAAWFGLLALDIGVDRADLSRGMLRAQYFVELAFRYSSLFIGPLIAIHTLRCSWLRWSSRVDTWLSLLLAAALALPCYKRADLLASGSLLFESRARILSIFAVTAALLLASLVVWHVHLTLVAAPRHLLADNIARRSRATRVRLSLLATLLGAGALILFAETVSRELRAYLFLSEFLLPGAFLCAASIVYGLQRTAAPSMSWVFALAIAVGLSTGGGNQSAIHREHAFFERRAGLIAITDMASSSARGAPYANLDISHPERFQCKPEPSPEPRVNDNDVPSDHRNVILISVDTLRKDVLTTSDKVGPIAPSLQQIAKQSLQFERAVTTYPATLFAVSSALTGQSPSEVMFAPRPPPNLFTLASARFQEVNIALPQASWFKRPPVPELFTQVVKPRFFSDAEVSTNWVLYRLREARARKRNLLTWVHYYEPHTTHVTRGRNREANARADYAELVRTVDRQIGRLWSELTRLDYLKDSLIIVFSDHGEALGEFGYFGHHVYLNQFATDVPLLVHAPETKHERVQQLALLSDIAPTVLRWLGLPSHVDDARDLLTLVGDHSERFGISEAFPVRGPALYEVARSPIHTPAELSSRVEQLRAAAIDYQPKVAVSSSHYRLIVNRVTGAEEFYDRTKDPEEHNDLAPKKLPAYKRMHKALENIMRERSERIYCRVANAGSEPAAPGPKPPTAGF